MPVGFLRSLLLLLCAVNPVSADLVSFDTGLWDHGSGSQLGWNDGELSGTTTVIGRTLTITSSVMGTAQATPDHMSRINASFFTGFAFQALPSSTDQNTVTLDNFVRLDFSFSAPIRLNELTLTDVDRQDGQWYDVIAAEAFSSTTPGAVGSGFDPNYIINDPSNIGFGSFLGVEAAGPLPGTGNVQNTPENDITVTFDNMISSFSIYYWNLTDADNAAGTQTIGIRGNAFTVSVPEPSSLILLLGGCTGIGFLRRRQHSIEVQKSSERTHS